MRHQMAGLVPIPLATAGAGPGREPSALPLDEPCDIWIADQLLEGELAL